MSQNNLCCSSEDFERAAREYKQIAEGLNDTLGLEGLSFLEAYIEGRLSVIVRFQTQILESDKPCFLDLWIKAVDPKVAEIERPAVCSDASESLQAKPDGRRDEEMMLVGDVELMDAVKPFSLPARKRLYVIKNDIADLVAGPMTRSYMSVDGTRHRVPAAAEGEVSVADDCMPVRFDEQTVCVVERSPEVMDGIADYCGRMTGKLPANGEGPVVGFTLLCLGPDSLSVLSHEDPKDRLKLVDVMFGPFGL